ncbi:MAG: indolepyruvate ferredoxin oxidoreductase subunit alpha [Promethearchaeota archaeon]
MDEKLWYKLARNIIKAGGPPIPINETLIKLLKTLITEKQLNFLLIFKKSLNIEQIKNKINLHDDILEEKLKELMHIGMITGIPSRSTGQMVYRLSAFLPGLLEHTLMRGESGPKQIKLAQLWDQLFEDSNELTKKNYNIVMEAFRNVPPIDKVVPIDQPLESYEESIFSESDVMKIINKFNIIAVSYCYCRHLKDLLNDPCKIDAPRQNCLTFGRSARFLIENEFAKEITKLEAIEILKESEKYGLVHKAFHTKGDPELEELALCNCCQCCCGNFQAFYKGTSPTHTFTSYRAQVNEKLCVGCGTCTENCPMQAANLSESTAIIDQDRCIGCGVCVIQCPEKAIELKKTDLRKVFIPAPKILK